ncbi:MAG: phosphatidylcholine/phosphatidylserine synthase, partial [Phycisphaerae bacterium]|nr:phosphatidylcholine/phosphatidylserine synthase [Phycisphaerae bacterium]
VKKHRIVILPSLFTLGNALCGFAAITFTTRAFIGEPDVIGFGDITIAGGFIFLAMGLDAIDGRLARMARATSDFGGQLDSLSDAISFGIAPAFLMHRIVVQSLGASGWVNMLILRTAWICAAIYVGSVLIRLARFNVENVHDEEAHAHFRGLPTPPAAGLMTALVIVLNTFWQTEVHEVAGHVMVCSLPVVGAVLGILMVSRIRYVHLVNYVLKGKRPIGHFVNIVFAVAFLSLLFVLSPQITTAVGFGLFVVSGPLQTAYRKLWKKDFADLEAVSTEGNWSDNSDLQE